MTSFSYLIMDKSTRIPISTFKTALVAANIDVDLEETEWMLANMIFKVRNEASMCITAVVLNNWCHDRAIWKDTCHMKRCLLYWAKRIHSQRCPPSLHINKTPGCHELLRYWIHFSLVFTQWLHISFGLFYTMYKDSLFGLLPSKACCLFLLGFFVLYSIDVNHL